MKIGILGTRGVPNAYGGFEQFAERLSTALVKNGHDVSVYNSSLHPYQSSEWRGVQIIHCRDLEHRLGTAGQFVYDWNCIADARKRGFDILLHLGYTSDSVWHWRWPGKAIHVVNMDGLEWKRSKYNAVTRRFLKYAESLAAKHADVMIADSPGIQKHIFEKYHKKPVYIPYGADIFSTPDPAVLEKYQLRPHEYFLMITRMEPENNVEMVIKGYLSSRHPFPLFVMGNITNKFGRHITSTYRHPQVRFVNAVYRQDELDNLRYFSSIYFHGHSVGGTNPSLLEAMACGCRIASHGNQFNEAVLQGEAEYFPSAQEVATIINRQPSASVLASWRQKNLEKIRSIYNVDQITSDYETLMLQACGTTDLFIQPVAEAV
ncbi:MAG TPA: DUF1972 domain-containing protein [Chitinophagaceae bacterium]